MRGMGAAGRHTGRVRWDEGAGKLKGHVWADEELKARVGDSGDRPPLRGQPRSGPAAPRAPAPPGGDSSAAGPSPALPFPPRRRGPGRGMAAAAPVPVPVAEAAGPGEEAAGAGPQCPGPARLARLPLARVKALVKADPDVSLASQEAVFVLARATVSGAARPARGPGRLRG